MYLFFTLIGNKSVIANTQSRLSALRFIYLYKDHQGGDCLYWPYAKDKNGYGRVRVFDRIGWAHREMCIAAHGDPPSSDVRALHSCGNGNVGCVNPRHLRWGTSQENGVDMLLHNACMNANAMAAAVSALRDFSEGFSDERVVYEVVRALIASRRDHQH